MFEIKQTYSVIFTEQSITARKVYIWKSYELFSVEQPDFISKLQSQTLLDNIGWSWLSMHVL